MANYYRVFNPVSNLDALAKINSLCTDVGLAPSLVDDKMSFTVNGNQKFYMQMQADYDVFIEPVSSADGTTLLSLTDVMSLTHGNGISEVHMFGYDNPAAVYILMRREDAVWMQICLGYCHPIGVHSGCFVAACSRVTYDGHSAAETFPYGYASAGHHNPMFGSYEEYGDGPGYVNVDIGNGAVEHWHRLDHQASGNCAASPVTIKTYNNTYQYPYQSSSFGYHKLTAAKQNFGWNTHLISVPFLIRDPDGYWIPVGYAPHIRAVRSEQHTVFDKINSAGTDFWLFPWFRNSVPADNTVSSHDYFWAFKVYTGQETPVLL